jgi:hypothetical protein
MFHVKIRVQRKLRCASLNKVGREVLFEDSSTILTVNRLEQRLDNMHADGQAIIEEMEALHSMTPNHGIPGTHSRRRRSRLGLVPQTFGYASAGVAC